MRAESGILVYAFFLFEGASFEGHRQRHWEGTLFLNFRIFDGESQGSKSGVTNGHVRFEWD
jgi:hypothetical protein